MAGLHRYFKSLLSSKEEIGNGEAATKEANAAAERVLESEREGRERKYQHYTPEQREKIGRFAAHNINAAAVRKFKNEFESLGGTVEVI